MRDILEFNRGCFISSIHGLGLKFWKNNIHQGLPRPIVSRMDFTDNFRVRIRKDFFFLIEDSSRQRKQAALLDSRRGIPRKLATEVFVSKALQD